MTKPVITRAWDRVVCAVSPGTGRHRLHSRRAVQETHDASAHERAQYLEAALAAEQEANRHLHAELRAPQQPAPVVIPIVKAEKANEDNPTIPIPAIQRPGEIAVYTLGGKPLLTSIPAQSVRE